MGITGGTKQFVYKSQPLPTIRGLKVATETLRDWKAEATRVFPDRNGCFILDASIFSNKAMSPQEIVDRLLDFLLEGMDVIIGCDNTDATSPGKREAVNRERIREMERKKDPENPDNTRPHTMLYNSLNRAVEILRSSGKLDAEGTGQIYIEKGVYQADYLIAGKVVHNLADIIGTTDGDFMSLLGPWCVFVEQIKGNTFRLLSPSKATLERVLDTVSKEIGVTIGIETPLPKYPLFDDPCLPYRILIAVFLGSDVDPGGIDGATVKAIWDALHQEYDGDVSESLKDGDVPEFLKKGAWLLDRFTNKEKNPKCQCTKDEVRVLVSALMDEPIREMEGRYDYLEIPRRLHYYVRKYRKEGDDRISIEEEEESSVVVERCPGVDGSLGHYCVRGEGALRMCKGKCRKIYCRLCFVDKNPETALCVNCWEPTEEERRQFYRSPVMENLTERIPRNRAERDAFINSPEVAAFIARNRPTDEELERARKFRSRTRPK